MKSFVGVIATSLVMLYFFAFCKQHSYELGSTVHFTSKLELVMAKAVEQGR